MIKSVWRSTYKYCFNNNFCRKNFVKGYSGIQIKVRKATSTDPWGPSVAQMSEIASATHNPVLFSDIIYIIDKRLNDHGKYWRHVYKSLVLLEYCVVCGSDSLVRYATDRIYLIRTLKEFVHYDEFGREQGAGVRQKSEDLVNILTNPTMLAEARRKKSLPGWTRNSTADLPRITDYPGNTLAIEGPPRNDSDDAELQRAIEESKRTAAAEEERRKRNQSEDGFFNNLTSPKQQPVNHKSGIKTIEYITEVRAVPYQQVKPRVMPYNEQQSIMQQSPKLQQRSQSYELPYEERRAIMPPTPAENPFVSKPQVLMLPEANPFDNEVIEASPNTDPFREIPQQAPMQEYNIPMPQQRTRSNTIGDMSMGAKPVLPANLTPQFSAIRSNPRNDPTYRPG